MKGPWLQRRAGVVIARESWGVRRLRELHRMLYSHRWTPQAMPGTDLRHSDRRVRPRNRVWLPGRLGVALGCAAVVLLVAGFVIARQAPVPRKLSLVFVEYKDWPGSLRYAELRLTNGTTNAVEYPIMRDGPRPNTVVLFYREEISGRWGEKKPEPESSGAVFTYQELKPGQSVTFLAPVQPGAPPKQAGIGWLRPPRRLTNPTWREWRHWSLRIRGLLHLKTPPTSPWDEVWCDKVLTIPGRAR